MAIRRVENGDRGYTLIRNDVFLDKSLSLKAKGVFCLMWSLPKEWLITIRGLEPLSVDGRESVASALKELEAKGYMLRKASRNERGSFDGYDYDLFESPYTGNPCMGNPPQYNTISINMNNTPDTSSCTKSTESSKNVKDTTILASPTVVNASRRSGKPEKIRHGQFGNVLLTEDELTKLKDRFLDWQDRIENASLYLEAKGDKYKSHYAMILNWDRMARERTAQAGRPTPAFDDRADFFARRARELDDEQG